MLLAFIAATWYSGKRFSPIATLLVSLTIVAANLLLPIGKVLFSLGPLVITDGALLGGMEKAVTFEGLMYASKACILPGLRLPGRFGSIVARAFVYYDRIIEYKGKVKPSTLVDDADALMLEIWEAEAEKKCRRNDPRQPSRRIRKPGESRRLRHWRLSHQYLHSRSALRHRLPRHFHLTTMFTSLSLTAIRLTIVLPAVNSRTLGRARAMASSSAS